MHAQDRLVGVLLFMSLIAAVKNDIHLIRKILDPIW